MKMIFLQRQKGLSLIELMIAMGLGALLLLALATLFVTANDSSKRRSTSENLDEVARQVMERLSYDLHEAGYIDPFSNARAAKTSFDVEDPNVLAIYARQKDNLKGDLKQATPLGRFTEGKVVPLLGCDSDFSGSTSPSLKELATCSRSAPPSSRQSIQISYQTVAPDALKTMEDKRPKETASRSLALKTQEEASYSGAGRDCIGRKLGDKDDLVVNRYSVRVESSQSGKTTRPGNFGCSSTAPKGEWQSIVEGVEEMTFRYLITPPDNTPAGQTVDMKKSTSGREVTKYLSASAVAAEELQWASVVGVEVCLIVSADPMDGTGEASLAATQPKIPTCLRKGGATATNANALFEDDIARPKGNTRFYRRYVQVISMPNSLYIP